MRFASEDPEDEKILKEMEEIEDQRNPPAAGLSDKAMAYLNQIKELQEQRDQQILAIETLDMAILGYSHALQEELGEKGH